MIKIGIIGLGDIAQKAYLPVITRKEAELHLHTRSEETLRRIGNQYRIEHVHKDLESLIRSGIKGAFVHTPTATHETIIEQLLDSNIHVYVDKPITYDYPSSRKLLELAQKKKLRLTVGFNRRFAPAYQTLHDLPSPNMMIMQKNRKALPGDVRKFVFDDFIHVLDTLLYLFPYSIERMTVTGKMNAKLLYHVVVQLVAAGGETAIGIMNRDSGTVEERVEVYTANKKAVVENLGEVVLSEGTTQIRVRSGDWQTMLYQRGFEQMVQSFLESLSTPSTGSYEDTLLTHRLCEEVTEKLGALQ